MTTFAEPGAPPVGYAPSSGPVVIALSGELDVLTVVAARQVLIAGTARVEPRVVVDLALVTFCDSSGVGLLVTQYKRVRMRGGVMALACPNVQLCGILRVTGLLRSQLFGVYDTVDEAREAVSG